MPKRSGVESGACGASSHRGGAGPAGAGAQSGAGNSKKKDVGRKTPAEALDENAASPHRAAARGAPCRSRACSPGQREIPANEDGRPRACPEA